MSTKFDGTPYMKTFLGETKQEVVDAINQEIATRHINRWWPDGTIIHYQRKSIDGDELYYKLTVNFVPSHEVQRYNDGKAGLLE